MKILEQFAFTNFQFISGHYQIKRSALEFLSSGLNMDDCNDQTWVDIGPGNSDQCAELSGIVDDVKRLLYKVEKRDTTVESSLLSAITFELANCFRDVKRYYYDFRSYRLSKTESLRKAHTICLLKVISHYWKHYNASDLLYKAMVLQGRKGEINCDSAKGFYTQVSGIIRAGIYKGILLT